VDPNQLCSDPDPGSHVNLDPEFSSQLVFKSVSMDLQTKINFSNKKNLALVHKICFRILSAPDPDPNQLFGSVSCK